MPAPSPSRYSIASLGAGYAIYRDRSDLILDDIETYGSAQGWVDELEAEDAARAEQEAIEAAECAEPVALVIEREAA